MSLKRFCETNYPNVSFKTDKQRKEYVEKRGLVIQKDDNGRDGIAVSRDDDECKEIRVGKRLSASKLKRMEYDELASKDEINNQHDKNSLKLNIKMNSKDHWFHVQMIQ